MDGQARSQLWSDGLTDGWTKTNTSSVKEGVMKPEDSPLSQMDHFRYVAWMQLT